MCTPETLKSIWNWVEDGRCLIPPTTCISEHIWRGSEEDYYTQLEFQGEFSIKHK